MSSLVKHRDDQSTNEANTLQFKNIIEARYRVEFLQNLEIQSNKLVVLEKKIQKQVARKVKKKQRTKLIISEFIFSKIGLAIQERKNIFSK